MEHESYYERGMNTDPVLAVNPDTGDLLDVHAVARGVKCGAICASCSHPVVAKQGKIMRWHFAHHATGSEQCVSGGESLIHRIARESILTDRRLPLPI